MQHLRVAERHPLRQIGDDELALAELLQQLHEAGSDQVERVGLGPLFGDHLARPARDELDGRLQRLDEDVSARPEKRRVLQLGGEGALPVAPIELLPQVAGLALQHPQRGSPDLNQPALGGRPRRDRLRPAAECADLAEEFARPEARRGAAREVEVHRREERDLSGPGEQRPFRQSRARRGGLYGRARRRRHDGPGGVEDRARRSRRRAHSLQVHLDLAFRDEEREVDVGALLEEH